MTTATANDPFPSPQPRFAASIHASVPAVSRYGRAVSEEPQVIRNARLFDEQTGFPPPGRFRLSFDDTAEYLVTAFPGSVHRPIIWEGFERYLARFAAVEEMRARELGGRALIKAIWIGGSFVSTKADPDNIDITVIIDAEARELIKGNPGSKWMTQAFNRERCVSEYLVSPVPVYYRPVISVFRQELLTTLEVNYLRARGAWDDWWQRCRDPLAADGSPSLETVHAVRGYLEVVL